jgi:hypothetical protein
VERSVTKSYDAEMAIRAFKSKLKIPLSDELTMMHRKDSGKNSLIWRFMYSSGSRGTTKHGCIGSSHKVLGSPRQGTRTAYPIRGWARN